MSNPIRVSLAVFLFTIFTLSCKKNALDELADSSSAESLSIMNDQKLKSSSFGYQSCVEDTDNGTGYDTLLKPTILDYHLVNHPYSLANMQQAYTNLFGNASGVALTHQYVRFKPSTPQQLSVLEDTDIDLFDYPLDYDVLQHGDYYDDGVTPAEEIPWLYTVVGIDFVAPVGITYEVLEQIHIPTLARLKMNHSGLQEIL